MLMILLLYADVIKYTDNDQWLKAINLEMESMYSKTVYELTNPLEDVRPIRCKWIIKIKRGVDGKMETFKTRLITKGRL